MPNPANSKKSLLIAGYQNFKTFLLRYTNQQLTLNGDIAFGAEEQFVNEARMAVRLANFISGFLQVK